MNNAIEENNEKFIQIVMNQTNYTREESISKLKEYNNQYVEVIKNYMGISISSKKNSTVGTINQEIYKQIRHKMNTTMNEYNHKHPIDVNQVISNFEEANHKHTKL